MNIKDRLLSISENIHSVDIGPDKLYFRHLKASHNEVLSKVAVDEINVVAFILALCEEDGSQVFTLDDIDQVKEIPRVIVNVVSNAAMMGNEAKPLGV